MMAGLTVAFLRQFGIGLWLTFPLILTLVVAILALGHIVKRMEGWSRIDAFYWSFITATTVGYGDFRPLNKGSKILAVLVALLGLILSGIIVAVAVRATTLALDQVRG